MQYYLKDGHEEKEITFNEKEIMTYNQYFNLRPLKTISPLYCAKLWPEFQLFQKYIKRNILLKSTEILHSKRLQINEKYIVHMYIIEKKKVKHLIKYMFKLEIYKKNERYISIKQIFLEEA
ncbi:MAG TPA: hypothetical protein VK115_04140 [Staphylococcus sp.]|nr:hypothetical protein [Staphylococcus sp.]